MRKIVYTLGVTVIMLLAMVARAEVKKVIRIDNKQIAKTDTLAKDSVLSVAEVMPQYPEGEADKEKKISKFSSSSLSFAQSFIESAILFLC